MADEKQIIFKYIIVPPLINKPIANAWVYVFDEGTESPEKNLIVRTDKDGKGFLHEGQGEMYYSWQYTKPYTIMSNKKCSMYYSFGIKPIPESILDKIKDIFRKVNVVYIDEKTYAKETENQILYVATNEINNVLLVEPFIIRLKEIKKIELTSPEEINIIPIIWENYQNTYYTSGINQGSNAWSQNSLNINENATAALADVNVKPKTKGFKINGQAPYGTKSIIIKIINQEDKIINIKETIDSTTSTDSITVNFEASSGTNFEKELFFDNATESFGESYVLIKTDGIIPQRVEAFYFYICGLQIVLVDDYSSNRNGQSRGSVLNESNEVVIAEYQNNAPVHINYPAALPANATQEQKAANAVARLAAENAARDIMKSRIKARRMICYQFQNETRNQILKPQVPLWMAEFQFLGIKKINFEKFMLLRYKHRNDNPTQFIVTYQWQLNLFCTGPDSRSYNESFTLNQTMTLTLNTTNNQIDNVNNNEVQNSLNPIQPAISFPITGRRKAGTFIENQSRVWGRSSTGTSKNTLIIEWQPNIVSGNNEIIRGGNGILRLNNIRINDNPLGENISLPEFRIKGINPAIPANNTINTVVEEYYNSHNVPRIRALLTLDCWKQTARLVFAHENAGLGQFDTRGTMIRKYLENMYGSESNMTIFGPPHGYGYGQLDPIAANNEEQLWNFYENIKEAVRRLMEDKATAAYTLISSHLPNPIDQRIRSVYQREIVRRYNGGREFVWQSPSQNTLAEWMIKPSVRTNLNYPNLLGTNVVYPATDTAFQFTSAMFGPGT